MIEELEVDVVVARVVVDVEVAEGLLQVLLGVLPEPARVHTVLFAR